MKLAKKETVYIPLVIFAYSAILLLFCTLSSPIYAFHDYVDQNAYFTMGKSIMNGYIPYKDIFEHKGPLLYIIFGIGYLLDHTGFFGIYLIETIFLFFSNLLLYKICNKFMGSIASLAASFATIYFVIMSEVFGKGAAAEEFSWLFILLGLYHILNYKMILKEKEKESDPIARDNMKIAAVIGLVFSALLLIKLTWVAFVFGLILPIFVELLIKKQWKYLLKYMASFLVAAGIPILVYLIYAIATDSLKDFWYAYISFNSIYGASGTTFAAVPQNNFFTILVEISRFLTSNLARALLIAVGIVFVLVGNHELAILNRIAVFFSFLFLTFAVSMKVLGYSYQPVILYIVFGFIFIFSTISKSIVSKKNLVSSLIQKKQYKIFLSTILLVAIFCLSVGRNALVLNPLMQAFSSEAIIYPQQQVADIINNDSPENQTLLQAMYFDSGFYTKAGILPSIKFFYVPLITYDDFPDPLDDQLETIRAKNVHYIVAMGGDPSGLQRIEEETSIYDTITNAILDDYEFVENFSGYNLYKLAQ